MLFKYPELSPRVFAGTENPKLATGEIEVVADELTILNKADVLPFPMGEESVSEDLRLEHRYLDLRRPEMVRNLTMRHKITKATRDYFDAQGFLEIETPLLSKSTPEGAREFLVPSRIFPGSFYALSQSPQQYKQLLMVGGVERYFQIAKCFRDEDPRADRITELTQIDVEISFATEEEIFSLVEGLLAQNFQNRAGRRRVASLSTPDLSGSHGSLWNRQAGSPVRDGARRPG